MSSTGKAWSVWVRALVLLLGWTMLKGQVLSSMCSRAGKNSVWERNGDSGTHSPDTWAKGWISCRGSERLLPWCTHLPPAGHFIPNLELGREARISQVKFCMIFSGVCFSTECIYTGEGAFPYRQSIINLFNPELWWFWILSQISVWKKYSLWFLSLLSWWLDQLVLHPQPNFPAATFKLHHKSHFP